MTAVLLECQLQRIESSAVYLIPFPILNFLSLKALKTTERELNAIAAAAIIGLRSGPPNANRTPAAIGIPRMLYAKAQKRFCLIFRIVA